jgi:hypothetical protein
VSGRLIVIGACAAGAACWVSAVLGGLAAARWCAAGCAALAALVIHAVTPREDAPRAPRHGAGRSIVRHPYPRFDQLVSIVKWAQRDRRYHDRVLTPLLEQIAADVDDTAPVDALRAELRDGLDRFERRHRRWM